MSPDTDETDNVGALTTRKLARALGVDPERLRLFVYHHPNPDPSTVLAWANAELDNEEIVAAWLDDFEPPD